jgi:hypothetical protein
VTKNGWLKLSLVVLLSQGVGCASGWKVHGGPKTCVEMCNGWDLEFAGMVGVGDQSPSGAGASACVCQVRKPDAKERTGGAAAATASLAGPITAAQAAAAAAAAQRSIQAHPYVPHPPGH